jgi:guanine nucleotide-binding protein subunit beta-2-like 1 protein
MNKKSITSKFVGFLKGHSDQVTSIVTGNSDSDERDSAIVISGSKDTSIILWDLEGTNKETKTYGKPLRLITGHSHLVTDLALTKYNSHLISSSWDRTMRLWNLSTFETYSLFKSDGKEINSVCLSRDDRMIYSGGCENNLKLWNTRGEKKNDSSGGNNNHKDWVSRVRYSPSADEEFFASVGWDGRLNMWNGHFNNNGYIQAHDAPAYALDITNNGTIIATGGKDQTVKLFNITESKAPKVTYKCGSTVNDVAFNPMYKMMATATDNAILVWDISGLESTPADCKILPESKVVVDEELEDKEEQEAEKNPFLKKGKKIRFTSLAWSFTGKFLYCGCSNGDIQVHKFDHVN